MSFRRNGKRKRERVEGGGGSCHVCHLCNPKGLWNYAGMRCNQTLMRSDGGAGDGGDGVEEAIRGTCAKGHG